MSEQHYIARILSTEFVAHDVKSLFVERPEGYQFTPGQATEVSLNAEGWREEGRPFTFNSLTDDPILQFKIKEYPEHEGVTQRIHSLGPGDELILRDAWGTIQYRGPGTFLAAGAGVTPFIAILRDLARKEELDGNSLFFSNKTHKDILLEREFQEMFASAQNTRLVFTLTREKRTGYEAGRFDREFLEERIREFGRNFYLCGPPSFVDSMKEHLQELGAETDSLVFEE